MFEKISSCQVFCSLGSFSHSSFFRRRRFLLFPFFERYRSGLTGTPHTALVGLLPFSFFVPAALGLSPVLVVPFWVGPRVFWRFWILSVPLQRPFLGREAACVFVVDSFCRCCFPLLWCLRLFHTLEGRTRRRTGIPPGGRARPSAEGGPGEEGLASGVWTLPCLVPLFCASVCVSGHRDPEDHLVFKGGALIAPPGPFSHTCFFPPQFFCFSALGASLLRWRA